MNKVMLLGRLTRDPEMKGTNGTTSVCRFGVACERPKAKGQEKAEADFINCVAFGKTAEFVNQYFKKGNRILIEDASILTGSFTSQKTGQKVYTTDVNVRSVSFVDSKKEAQQEAQSSYGGGSTEDFGQVFDSDLPF